MVDNTHCDCDATCMQPHNVDTRTPKTCVARLTALYVACIASLPKLHVFATNSFIAQDTEEAHAVSARQRKTNSRNKHKRVKSKKPRRLYRAHLGKHCVNAQ